MDLWLRELQMESCGLVVAVKEQKTKRKQNGEVLILPKLVWSR